MNKEKQIEEMIKDIDKVSEFTIFGLTDAFIKVKVVSEKVAENLYAAGYRKQSEWINVEERLPEVAQKVLLFSPSDGINLGYVTNDKRFYVYKSYPDRPTHWMPLPAPPTEKEN